MPTAIHVKKDWRAHVPGFPQGETLNTRYCRVCERYLEDHPDIGIRTEKEFGLSVADDWRELADNPHSAYLNPTGAPTSTDALERLLVQGEMGAGTDVWEHLFEPGRNLHRHASEEASKGRAYADLSGLEKLQDKIQVWVGGKAEGKAGKKGKKLG